MPGLNKGTGVRFFAPGSEQRDKKRNRKTDGPCGTDQKRAQKLDAPGIPGKKPGYAGAYQRYDGIKDQHILI